MLFYPATHFMNPHPLVSIIIPFVHEIDYLREAVQSALDQRLESCQILLVCNAPEMIHIEEKNPFDHTSIIWLHEPAPGAPHARNMGLAHATGEWIQFLDVDDLLLPDKIATQIKYSDADVIVSPITYRYISGKEKRSASNPSDTWYSLLASEMGSTSSMLWRRTILQQVGGWNPEFASVQEYELLFRILKEKGRITFDDNYLTVVRQRRSGSITTSRLNHPMTGIRLREDIWKYLQSEGLDTEHRLEAFRIYIFKNLRGLYRLDPAQATQLHNTYFLNSGFRPSIKGVPGYHGLYKIFGFHRTELIMQQYRRLRDVILPWLPKNE